MSDPTTDLTALRRRLLGRGVACTRIDPTLDYGRDVAFAEGENGLDLAMVDDLDNLAQCLEIALTTLAGSDFFNTNFGFDGLNAFVSETNQILLRERIRVSLIGLLQQDTRVRRIIDLKLADGRLEHQTAPKNIDPADALEIWRTVRANVAFETVAGDSAVLNLGKVPADA
jgi:hypothetical protein